MKLSQIQKKLFCKQRKFQIVQITGEMTKIGSLAINVSNKQNSSKHESSKFGVRLKGGSHIHGQVYFWAL